MRVRAQLPSPALPRLSAAAPPRARAAAQAAARCRDIDTRGLSDRLPHVATSPPPMAAPFRVGFLDLDWDEDTQPAPAGVDPDKGGAVEQPPDPDRHVVARLFYPAAAPGGAVRPPSTSYLPHRMYAAGWARFLTAAVSRKGVWWAPLLRRLILTVVWTVTAAERLHAEPGAAPADASAHVPDELPVVVFSHGLAGNRLMYSSYCVQLAQRGFAVLALEHADGLASAARLAGRRGWMMYAGWGTDERREQCNVHRVKELATSLRMLCAVSERGASGGALVASGGDAASALAALRGRLSLAGGVTVAGHSYGAGTAAAAAATLPNVHSAILLDPWWPAIPLAVRTTDLQEGWKQCPVFVIGSAAFNKRGPSGALVCEGPGNDGLQEAVLEACARAADAHANGDGSARGAVLVVPRDSQHSLVDDMGSRFLDKYAWLARLLFGRQRMTSTPGKDMADRCTDACAAFLVSAAPLPARTRAHLDVELRARWDDAGITSNGAEWKTESLPDLLAGDQRTLLRWQQRIFSQTGPGAEARSGVEVLKAYQHGARVESHVADALDLVTADA